MDVFIVLQLSANFFFGENSEGKATTLQETQADQMF